MQDVMSLHAQECARKSTGTRSPPIPMSLNRAVAAAAAELDVCGPKRAKCAHAVDAALESVMAGWLHVGR